MDNFEVKNNIINRFQDDSYQSSNLSASKTNNKSDVIISQIINDHSPFVEETVVVNESHLVQTVNAFCHLKNENPLLISQTSDVSPQKVMAQRAKTFED